MAQLSIIFFLHLLAFAHSLITKHIVVDDLPEYSEYLRRLERKNALAKTTLATPTSTVFVREDKDLPEYSEYLRRLERKNTFPTSTPSRIFPKRKVVESTTLPMPTTKALEMIKEVPMESPFPIIPFIKLCTKSPEKDDFYGHVYCWLAFLAYALLTLSLIIYQLRSILWLKAQTKRQGSMKDLEANGDTPNK